MKTYLKCLSFTLILHIVPFISGDYMDFTEHLFHFAMHEGESIQIKMISLSNKQIIKRNEVGKTNQETNTNNNQFNNFSENDQDSGQKTILASYLTQVRNIIEKNKHYPHRAKRLNHEGTVNVSFILLSSGEVKEIKSIQSPFITLESAIEKLLKTKNLFPSFPAELKENDLTIEVGINFKLD